MPETVQINDLLVFRIDLGHGRQATISVKHDASRTPAFLF